MEIKALDLPMESIILPVVILALSLFLLFLGIRLMGATKRFEKTSGFVAVGIGLVLFAGSLIPIVSSISAADKAVDYRDYLYQEYSMKLEVNSRLVLAMRNVDEKTVIPVKDVVIGTQCGTQEKVDIYDLWVSRRGDTIYLFEKDSKPLQLCGPTLSPITFRKMPW